MIRINRTIPELIINIKSSGISISVCKVNDIAYQMALKSFGEDALKALQLRPIAPDEVTLTPKLIRYNR